MRKQKARSLRQAARWWNAYEVHKELHNIIKREAPDILASENFEKIREYIQHGNMTINSHCINVAKCSILLNRKLRVGCVERDLIRGALLHDYFLYDWHDDEHKQLFRLHGFFHPRIALVNASKEYSLTLREQDIIKKHMWPLTVVPPMCREAWVVTTADKWCSFLETVRLRRGHGTRKAFTSRSLAIDREVVKQ